MISYMRRQVTLLYVRVPLVYFVVSTLWIFLSDSILFSLSPDNNLLQGTLSLLKGTGFVIVTTVVLAYLLFRESQKQTAMRQEIQASETRYRLLANMTSEGIIIHRDGTIVDVNKSLSRLLGWQREDVIGKQVIEFLFPKSMREDIRNRITSGDLYSHEIDVFRKDGVLLPVEIRTQQIDSTKYAISLRDITIRKKAETINFENERLKVRFQEEREHNSLVQQVILALSHDLRNSLSVIQTSRDILSRYLDRMSDERCTYRLDLIRRQVQYAMQLLEKTVQMARGEADDFNPKLINIELLCQVSLEDVQSFYNTTHQFQFVNTGQVRSARIDEVLVSRILINLLSNAVKYSPDNSEVRLELDRQDKWIVLRVTDQGIGISKDDLQHLFDPFFRSEEVQGKQGTGLGLSIVQDCVERHQGQIDVESRIGQGSIFTVKLPIQPKSTN